MELLAQVVEEISILTTKRHARKEPRKIERPGWTEGGGSPKAEQPSSGNPFARAIDRMMGFSPGRNVQGEYTGMPPDHLKAAVS
jgi:hypothetical protein